MAVLENTTVVDGVRFGARVSGLISNVVGAVITWNDKRLTRNALSGLSSRELSDIGLSRHEIENL